MGKMVPGYLQFSLETLVKEQDKVRSQFASAFSSPAAAFDAYQAQAIKNMAVFEQALSMWNPFHVAMQSGLKKPQETAAVPASGAAPAQGSAQAPIPMSAKRPQIEAVPATRDDLGELKAQLAAMQQKIEKLSQSRD